MPRITRQNANPVRSLSPRIKERQSAWDLSDSIRMLLYGRSGTGKTTLWATFPKPILALICSGGNRPGELKSIDTPENRKMITARIIADTNEMREELGSGEDWGTVVLDHASGLQDLVLKEILGLSGNLPAQKSWGLATQQQYGQCSLQCKELFRSVLGLPCNVVIIAQERSFGDGEASDSVSPTVGAALTPSVTGWLNSACDYVVQSYIRPKTTIVTSKIGGKDIKREQRAKGVEYCLRTEPHDVYQTKFRMPKGQPLPECITDPTYDKIKALIDGHG